MIREWILFALCLGAGGHIALAVVLHAPDLWPWSSVALYGLLSGLMMYGVVQAGRLMWKLLRPSEETASREKPGSLW
ncbi:MAG TPA: hypothetical protein VFS39_17300 [Nitrospira sp.]|nr:hypothetical protein [Nitrospira sp.]